MTTSGKKTQIQKFRETARASNVTRPKRAFDRILKRLAKAPPPPKHKLRRLGDKIHFAAIVSRSCRIAPNSKRMRVSSLATSMVAEAARFHLHRL